MSDPYILAGQETERRLPGFWRYFKQLWPEYVAFGGEDGPPMGAMLMPLCERWGDAIQGYVLDNRKVYAERVLANVSPEIRNEVAYALDLAAVDP